MERLLADASKIANTEFNIDSYADVIEAIHVIQDEMGITGTTMEEGSKTISGSLNQLNGAWENFLTAIGDGGATMDLTQVTDNLITSIGDVAYNVVPAIVRIGTTVATELPSILMESVSTGLAGTSEFVTAMFGEEAGKAADAFIGELAPMAPEISNIFGNLGSIIEQAVTPVVDLVKPVLANLSGAFTNGASIILGALSGVTAFVDSNVMPTISAVLDTISPIIDTISRDISEAMQDIQDEAGQAFNGVLDFAEEIWPDISDIITEVVTTVGAVVKAVWPVIKTIAGSVFNGVKAVVQTVWPVVSNVIKTAVNTAKNVVSTAFGAIKRVVGGISSIVGSVRSTFNNVLNAIKSPIEKAREAVKGALDKIKGFFPLNIGNVFSGLKLPHFSVSGGSFPWGIGGKGSMPSWSVSWYKRGGFVDNATLLGAGEAGTEFIWPGYDPYMSRYAQAIADHMPGNNQGVTVNFSYSGDADATEIVNLLTRDLRQLKATGVF